MNTNGILTFEEPNTLPTTRGYNFSNVATLPTIAPFWDDVDLNRGGNIYFRQDSNSTIKELIQRAIASEYSEAASFQPSLVFVVTWDRVGRYRSTGPENTFQVIIASDGTWTFIRFSYGVIQWGGLRTLIGVTAGDRVNFVMHPASLSSSVLTLDYTTTIYRVDG